MTINRLEGIEPPKSVQTTQKTQSKAPVKDNADSIAVSQEAKELADAYHIAEIAAQTPDVREDRIQEVKAKLNDPNYINDAVIDIVADRIMDTYGI